ncbi:hypothetical protein H1P_3020005 [Hyella patelloides LEGE 07179]|uniref:Response regulatory domain-containing protein n=1 Tax=Hyella patelloides LEGE 07179 TaxID=945734 RepID=A0A563VUG9_9CYAN|nr:response regulator [Hyella patelloides]VEP15053.1 hypothetical protein H1P_3020005 [Hyella patelloides LEGE 07179]
MKLHSIERVHSYGIDSVLAKDRPTKKRDYAFAYSTDRELKLTEEFEVNAAYFSLNERKNGYNFCEIKSPTELSLVETVSAPPHTIDFEPNLLEQHYQPEYLWFHREVIKPQILVIEHRDDSRNLIATILREENFQVIEAKDSNTAINLAKSERPDIIICELMMPIIDGYGILNLLRQSELTNKIPLLFIAVQLPKNKQNSEIMLVNDKETIEPLTAEKLLTEITHRLYIAIAKR